jgi:predicted glycosyltransferase
VCALGGGEDGVAVARIFLAAMGRLVPRGWDGLLVTGPLMAAADRSALVTEAGSLGVACVPFVDDLPSLLAVADVAVSMAGYNTVCEVLSAGTPAVLIPRVVPRKEQLIRARLMAEHGLAATLLPGDATGDSLAAMIEEEALADRAALADRRTLTLGRAGLDAAAAALVEVSRRPLAVPG